MSLDEFLPQYQFFEVHCAVVRAPPAVVFRAVKELTVGEISPLVRMLFFIRSLPALLRGRSGMGFSPAEPLLGQMLAGGFTLLEEIPDREIIFGIVGRFWRLSGDGGVAVAGAPDFLRFDRLGYARVAANLYVSPPDPAGDCVVRTESRTYVPDARARRTFARYWWIIHPGSALIRRWWLAAIKRRAQRSVARMAGNIGGESL